MSSARQYLIKNTEGAKPPNLACEFAHEISSRAGGFIMFPPLFCKLFVAAKRIALYSAPY